MTRGQLRTYITFAQEKDLLRWTWSRFDLEMPALEYDLYPHTEGLKIRLYWDGDVRYARLERPSGRRVYFSHGLQALFDFERFAGLEISLLNTMGLNLLVES